MVTSASSGPRLQSFEETGDNGSAVGGEGAGVSVDDASVGVDVGPSAGGVLVLVATVGGCEGVAEVQLDNKIVTRISKVNRIVTGVLVLLDFKRFGSAVCVPIYFGLIKPSDYYRTTQSE
jgi:hypothetical protein